MSTLSSDCECEFFENAQHVFTRPPCPVTGQPIIYYSQMPQPITVQPVRREYEKGNPNLFMKAFRWYTEDLVPHFKTECTESEVIGFAEWLDGKYEQFVLDNNTQKRLPCHFKMKNTSIVTSAKVRNSYKTNANDQQYFVKSPWKRKRQTMNEKDNENAFIVCDHSDLSFEYILQPKDLGHPSKCCLPLKEIVKTEKQVIKSHSLSNVYKDKGNIDQTVEETRGKNAQIDDLSHHVSHKKSKLAPIRHKRCPCRVENLTYTMQDEGTQYETKDSSTPTNDNKIQRNSKVEKSNYDHINIKPDNQSVTKTTQTDDIISTSVKSKNKKQKNVICRCFEENETLKNQTTQTQTDSQDVFCQCPDETLIEGLENDNLPLKHMDTVPKISTTDKVTQYEHQMSIQPEQKLFRKHQSRVDKGTQYEPPMTKLAGNSNSVEKSLNNDDNVESSSSKKIRTSSYESTPKVPTKSHFTAQTSNNAINLGQYVTGNEYPLFMRIVRADKLNKDDIK